MLSELKVSNLGVIDEATLLLRTGLTALTGETGAGKTLLVSAIDLLTGGRADATLVAPTAQEAEIEGRFINRDSEIVVRRVISREGRSRAYINGRLATVAELAAYGSDLVDLHGQHSHQSLLKSSVQRAALDRFGEVDTTHLQKLQEELQSVQSARTALGGDARNRAREMDLLSYQVNEISEAAISNENEDEQLDELEDRLAAADSHRGAAASMVTQLDADSLAHDALSKALVELQNRKPFDDLEQRLRALIVELADLVATVRDRGEAIEVNPAQLETVRQRRALLRELRRKYGATLKEVIAYGQTMAARLAELQSHDERATEADVRIATLTHAIEAEQAQVLASRRRAAPKLVAQTESNLAALAMPAAKLAIRVNGSAGEKVALWLAANPGHEPLPLAKVASGGELARTMLALRLVLTVGPPTLLFDEVDAGIGGQAAKAVAESLASLANTHQVLVVTHLPQIAALAKQHFRVAKDAATGVSIAQLPDHDARIVELSRMLSGSPDSISARSHAKELLSGSS